MALRRSYLSTAPKGVAHTKTGFNLNYFGGLVTGLDANLIPDDAASAMLNLERENGIPVVRKGYRNIVAPVTNQTTNKGFFRCETYVLSANKECFVTFDKVSGTLKPYELAYDNSSDTWSRTVITAGGSGLNLDDTYWRSVCFQDSVYFFNPNDATYKVAKYSIGTTNSWSNVQPPADPATPPAITYYNNTGSLAYARALSAQASYALTDVTGDGTVGDTGGASSVTANGWIKVRINANGRFTFTLHLKHGGGSFDLSNSDVQYIDVQINDTTKFLVNLIGIKASFVSSSGPTTQEASVTVVDSTVDSNGDQKRVRLYLKLTKGSRTTWASATDLVLEGDVTNFSGADYIFISPLVCGGIVDWGETTQWQTMYAAYDSVTTYESGPSLSRTLDRKAMDGTYVPMIGNQGVVSALPLGTVPRITITAGAADYFRLYIRTKTGSGPWSAWRRVVEQLDATPTYDLVKTFADIQALDEYAPASFDYTNLRNACVFKEWVVWLYAGGSKNVRHSRWGNAVAQASLDDAFKTSISQDDILRGANFTLNNDFQDEPIGGVQLGNALVILGKQGVYIQYDTNGLPWGMTPPEVVAGAPGCFGPNAYCRFHDGEGQPIVVYLDSRGDQLWAVRIPRGYVPGQPLAQAAWEYGSLVRNGLDSYLYGSSASRNSETACVYVDPRNDSLHLRYNVREVKQGRPDIKTGQRHWVPVQYGTGQYGSQWTKVVAFFSGTYGHGIFGIRLTGAIDEFEQANMKHPTTGARYYLDLTGDSATPSGVNAGTDVVPFDLPPGWSSGTPVTPANTGNGLTGGSTYYMCRVTSTTYTIHSTQADAQAGTNKFNLTGVTWSAGALTPLGRDDGAAIDSDIYFTGKAVQTVRRRPVRAHIQKNDKSDVFTVVAADEFGNTKTATLGANKLHGTFGVGLSSWELRYKIVFSESNSPITGFWTEEALLGQQRAG